MVVGEVAERTDVVVIGAGPGGYAAALRCAGHGKSVVLIERDRVGGTCLNVGCIPSKVLIHSADLAYSAVTSSAHGVALAANVDAAQIQQHCQEVVSGLTSGVEALLKHAKVSTWAGEARFSRPNRLAITSGDQVRHLEFDDVIVATGSRPIELPNLAFDGKTILDSTSAVRLDYVPEKMIVVGGGYIGIELGTAWSKLGSVVTIVEATSGLLPAMDPRLGRTVRRRLKELGIDVMTNSLATRLDNGKLVVTSTTDPSAEQLLECDVVFVAVGRKSNIDELGLERFGPKISPSGHIIVNPQRQAAPHIYAIGDITEGPALAHKATAEAEVAADSIAGIAAAFDPAAIPEVVFCDPEIVSVGYSPDSAKAAQIENTTFRFPFLAGSRSRTIGDTAGFVQLVADEHGTIIGAQAAGHGVSELSGELALAIEMGATAVDLADTIHAHPTMSEAISEAALGLDGRPLHVTN